MLFITKAPQGHEAVCKAFDYGTSDQRELMVAAVVPRVTEWGDHPQGRMVVSKAFDYGTSAQRELMVASLDSFPLTPSKGPNSKPKFASTHLKMKKQPD